MSAGIPATELSDDDLERELGHLHEKRHDILFGGTADQLANHVARTHELEHAALERFASRIPEAAAKIEALHADSGQRTIKGSVTEPLARGEHTEHGWQAEAPDLDGPDHAGNVSGVDNETGTEQAVGATSSASASAGDRSPSSSQEQRHPDAASRDGARNADSVADEQDDAEAMEQARRS